MLSRRVLPLERREDIAAGDAVRGTLPSEAKSSTPAAQQQVLTSAGGGGGKELTCRIGKAERPYLPLGSFHRPRHEG